jgi:hypothetical protein
MAKQKNEKTVKAESPVNIDEMLSKYFWIVIPLLTLLYYWLSTVSVGFYQDDEIAQYLNAVKFKIDPFSILGNNPKPGWKIFLIIPAIFDYKAVLFFNAFVASLSVYFTFLLIREYKINYAFFGALLLAFQPLFFDLSFRSYSEIFTSLLLVIFLLLYKREKFFIAGLLSGYIFTIRQEIAVFCAFLFILFIYRKQILPALSIAVFPLIYNILGFVKTGDMLFIMSEMKSVAALTYNTQGIFHYFKVYIFIVGPVCLTLFLEGFFGFFADTKKFKEYINQYILIYVLFVTVFAVQIYTMWNNGPNPGNWRYLLHISPVAVIFATIGLNNLVLPNFKKIHISVTAFIFIVTLVFLSKGTDGFKLLENTDFTKVFFIAVFFLLTFFIPSVSKIKYLNTLSVLLIVTVIIYLYADFKPKQLSPENQTVKSVAESLNGKTIVGNFYTNHSVLLFYLNGYKENPAKFLPLNSKYIYEAPKGSVFVWENHYGYRPEFQNDIKIESFQNNPDYNIINQYVSLDKRFAAYIIEKIK